MMNPSVKTPFRAEFQGRIVYLGRVSFRVFNVLKRGGKHTGADLCRECYITDPRGHIATLRKNGIPVSSVWVSTSDATKCKKYFLDDEK